MPFGLGGKKEEIVFKAEYLGGHSAYPKKRDVHLNIEDNGLDIPELNMNLPWKTIKSVESTTKDKIALGRVLLLGVVGALWKKEKLLMVLTYDDQVVKQEQKMVFDVDKIDKAQPAIYQKIASSRV